MRISVYRKIFNFISWPALIIARRPNKLTVALLEKLQPVYKQRSMYGAIYFSVPGSLIYWRAKTLYTKEPDTIAWIDQQIPDSIFYDIGANIGIYSIYAAAKGLRTYSFEPESQNYSELNKNIFLNSFSKNISAYNVALANKNELGLLHMSFFEKGGSMNNFGEQIDFNKVKFDAVFSQPVMAFRLDDFIEKYNLPLPNYIKIDVDGLEEEVLQGALKTIQNSSVRSILIELNDALEVDQRIKKQLIDFGYYVESKYHSPIFDGSAFSAVYNYIFSR